MSKIRKAFNAIHCVFLLLVVYIVPKKKSKVIQVVNSLENGGLEQIVIDLHHELLRQRFESRICIWSDNVASIANQIEDWSKVTILVENRKSYLKYLVTERPSSIHFHHSTLGVRYLTFSRIKLIYTMHNVYTWLDHKSAKNFYRLLSKMDVIANVSNSVKKYYLFRAGLVGARITKSVVVENAVDFSKMSINAKPKTDFGKIHLLVAANFYPTKSLFTIFGFVEEAANRGLDVEISIAGYESNKLYHKEFMEHLGKFELATQIHVLGAVKHAALLEMFGSRQYDALLSLSLQEGCSVALLEAIGNGLPVITTNTGNAFELQQHWNSIFVADNSYNSVFSLSPSQISNLGNDLRPSNLDSLIKQLQIYAANKASFHLAAHEQISPFRDEYGLSNLAKKYISLY